MGRFQQLQNPLLYVLVFITSVLGYGLVFVGQRMLEVHGLTLFGMSINLTVLPKYALAILHGGLLGVLFPNKHALFGFWQVFLLVIIGSIVIDFATVIAIKKEFFKDLGLVIHRFFLTIIKISGSPMAIVLGIVIHKLETKKLL
ncbi:MAG: hypothetical protein RLZZ252_92 [Bacteroidota bacterium]|jgi:hypothetical protein